jgi:hypothetical protein
MPPNTKNIVHTGVKEYVLSLIEHIPDEQGREAEKQ